jgi:endothelin-converting enzyme/putative endopeptidase
VNHRLAAALAVAVACATSKTPPAAPAGGAPAHPAAPGIDASIVDRSVNPCVDFYAYACGGWLAKPQIPADRARWVRSFDVIREENRSRLRGILEPAAAGKVDPQDRYGHEVAELYAGCMDAGAAERDGLARLKAQWQALDAVSDPKALATAAGRLHATGIFPLFAITSSQDDRDATQVIGEIIQGGLTLPDRDYYTKDDERSAAIRKDFLGHMAKELSLAGVGPAQAEADAKAILALETAMAGSQWTRVERRDPVKTYNRLDLAGLEKAAPRFPWQVYLAALGEPTLTAFSATTPQALRRLDALVADTPPATWRAYLRWHVLDSAAALRALPAAMSEEAFWFGARNFSGEKAMPERWKHCVDLTDALMPEALGQAFVRRYFAGDAKEKALSLVHGIGGAMGARLATLPWMDDATRKRAEEKLSTVNDKIAYPEQWRSYDGLVVRRDDFLGSALAAEGFEVRRKLAQIGKPVDRSEWRMSPPTVNAYYNAQLNEIVFPAGILQPPFYTQGANDGVNHGAIGLVVGHELTHGFDDRGRKYDAKGNLADWWTPAAAAEFERRAGCVERQYSAYVAIDDVKVNGKLTLGENIADLGGLKLAFAAYTRSRQGKPPEPPVAGFTPEQQLFLAHGQAWCAQIRPENARLRAVTDPHSPAQWRVNGPLSNLPEFAQAFQCKAGDPMVRAERCDIW